MALQDAAERIRRGAAALKERLAQDDAHYQQAAELQRGWLVRRAAPPQDRFYVDVSLRPSLAEPDPRARIDIIRVTLHSKSLCCMLIRRMYAATDCHPLLESRCPCLQWLHYFRCCMSCRPSGLALDIGTGTSPWSLPVFP